MQQLTRTRADWQGLSQAEVAARRARGQGNDVQVQTGRTYGQILRENVFTFINNVLFGLGLALVLLGRVTDALVTVGVITVNLLVSVIQELRAKHVLERLLDLGVDGADTAVSAS